MPNTFAPRAFQEMVKDRTRELRLQYDGDAADIKEWYGIIDQLGPKETEEFLDRYNTPEDIPDVVSGVEHEEE